MFKSVAWSFSIWDLGFRAQGLRVLAFQGFGVRDTELRT